MEGLTIMLILTVLLAASLRINWKKEKKIDSLKLDIESMEEVLRIGNKQNSYNVLVKYQKDLQDEYLKVNEILTRIESEQEFKSTKGGNYTQKKD